MKFLKAFGFGLLYALLLPVLIVFAAAIGVYGIGIAIYEGIKLIIGFFKGETGFPKLEEDIQAEQIRQARVNATWNAQTAPQGPAPAPAPSTVYVQQNYYQNPQPQVPPQPNPYETSYQNPQPLPQSNPCEVPYQNPQPQVLPQSNPYENQNPAPQPEPAPLSYGETDVSAQKEEPKNENPFEGLEDDLL